MPLRRLTQATCGLAALVALSPAALAGTFTISPLRVDLGGARSTAALTVRNEDAAQVVVQAQGLLWSQADGEDALEASRDLLISPAVFTLPPGGQQLVRVALRRPADPARELTYRLTLQEVPQAANPGFTGLQVALRLSVPVFVAPVAPAAPALDWSLTRDAAGRLVVTAHNAGAAHARIHRFVLQASAPDTAAFQQPALAYVLPGATRRWTFGDDPRPGVATRSTGGPFRLEGTTDRGPFTADLALVQE